MSDRRLTRLLNEVIRWDCNDNDHTVAPNLDTSYIQPRRQHRLRCACYVSFFKEARTTHWKYAVCYRRSNLADLRSGVGTDQPGSYRRVCTSEPSAENVVASSL